MIISSPHTALAALSPDRPIMSGTAQNPDVYFQGRETVNKFYNAAAGIVQQTMDKFAKLVGRSYHLFDYVGAADAEKVIIVMGSGADAVHETVDALVAKGEKVGLVKVRLFRPFDTKAFVAALPASVKKIAVLDRTKEPGSIGEPLVYGCSHGNRRGDARRHSEVQELSADRRRKIRTWLEGIYTCDGKGRL